MRHSWYRTWSYKYRASSSPAPCRSPPPASAAFPPAPLSARSSSSAWSGCLHLHLLLPLSSGGRGWPWSAAASDPAGCPPSRPAEAGSRRRRGRPSAWGDCRPGRGACRRRRRLRRRGGARMPGPRHRWRRRRSRPRCTRCRWRPSSGSGRRRAVENVGRRLHLLLSLVHRGPWSRGSAKKIRCSTFVQEALPYHLVVYKRRWNCLSNQAAAVAERLRRLTRNQIPSGSAGSNPARCVILFLFF